MDTKRMFLGIILITALGLGYQAFILHEYKVHPNWRRPDQTTVSAPTDTSTIANQSTAATQRFSMSPATNPSTQPAGWSVAAGATTQPVLTIGSASFNDTRYHLALAIAPQGAGLDWVCLNQYRQEVDGVELYKFQAPYDLNPDLTRALTTVAVNIDGTRFEVWDKPWTLASQSDHDATYTLDVVQNGAPALRLSKEFVIEGINTEGTTPQGYEVQLNYSIANLTAAAHKVSLEFNGPTVPRAETARQDTEIVAGYDNDQFVKLQHQPLGSFTKANPTKDFIQNTENLKMLWMGPTSNYFNAMVHPVESGKILTAVASLLNPDAAVEDHVVGIKFTTTDFDVPAAGESSLKMRVFLGPKLRSLLNSVYYGQFPLKYDDTLVLVTNWFCGLCTFPWLISFLVMLLGILHAVLRDWGLAIIALVCGVRLILHPITKRSQVSMMKMQKLAPEMERLKKKHGDDKEAFTKAQMELYKTVGFTPVLGCLPMFLQMPIFIALWRALQTTFELRQAPFLYFFGVHFTWIHDLSQPDALIKFSHAIALPFGWHLSAINILPLAMAVVTFVNQKYFTPKPAAMSAEQEQQQKMMMWMTLVFPFMFYTFPSGLNLYYLTSTSLGILESKRIRDHIKHAEAVEAATGPVIVDAGKLSRVTRRRQSQEPFKAPQAKGWLAKLQEKAEKMAREAQQQQKKK